MARKQVKKQLYYKIGEACKLLDIQPYVLRYWETEFPLLAPSKSKSGQRVYSEKELALIRRIKELLYEEGYTIAGAKKKLDTELAADGSLSVPQPTEAPTPAQLTVPVGPGQGDDNRALEHSSSAIHSQPAAPLDSAAAEKLKTLHEGIAAALRDAREILSLLSSS